MVSDPGLGREGSWSLANLLLAQDELLGDIGRVRFISAFRSQNVRVLKALHAYHAFVG